MSLQNFKNRTFTQFRPPFGLLVKALLTVYLLGFCALVFGQDTEGTTYYVRSLEGSDSNDGISPETAWKTVKHAARKLTPGDTLIIGPGLYREGVQLESGGLPGRPLRIMGDATGKLTNDPSGPVVMAGSVPIDESIFKPEGAPGVFMADFSDFEVLGAVEMDGHQGRYKLVHDPISDIPYVERVHNKKSSVWYESKSAVLYIHTSDDKPPTEHELEVIRSFSGFYLVGKPHVWISGITFRNFSDAGIYFRNGSDHGRAFDNVAFGSRQGFRVQNSNQVQILRNTMFRNENSGVYFLRGSLGGLVQGNFTYENLVGIRFSSESNAGLTIDNIIVDNTDAGLSYEKVIFQSSYHNTLKGNLRQLRIRTKPSFYSDNNCYESDSSQGQFLAHDNSVKNFQQLNEFASKYGVDFNSSESDCEISPEKVNVAELHKETLDYSKQSSEHADP